MRLRVIVTGGSGFIGTNYLELLRSMVHAEFLNLDHRPPRNPDHRQHWQACDLLDGVTLRAAVRDFSPTHVVHLAARTGMHEVSLDAFAPNMEGVENLLSALAEVGQVERVVFTSTMLVCRVGYVPKHDTDFQPPNLYGKSKARMEMIIRSRDLPYAWTIIRPISIWGPWGKEPFDSLFRAIAKGWYFHVGSGHYRKLFGYVENTVHQIHQLLLAPRARVDRRTMYVADMGLSLREFTESARRVFGAPCIRHIPYPLARFVAMSGDVARSLGWKGVPLTSFRLNNIVTEHHYNISPILELSNPLPFDLPGALERTATWMRKSGRL